MKSILELVSKRLPVLPDVYSAWATTPPLLSTALFGPPIPPPPVSTEFAREPWSLPSPCEWTPETLPAIRPPHVHKPCPTTLKHIVISGGSDKGFSYYAALRESHRAGFWKLENIETVYGTSVGSIFAIFIVLLNHFSWEIYDNFLLKRPWHHIMNFNVQIIAQSIQQKGIFGSKVIEDILAPLFHAIDLSLNITMREFYEFTGIELHITTVELANFELVDICHTTHPDWKVVDAVYASSCLPILFIPYLWNDRLFVDGGFVCNYPVHLCIERGANPDEILGITSSCIQEKQVYPVKLDTLPDYILYIIGLFLFKVAISATPVKNQIVFSVYLPFPNLYKIYKTTTDPQVRADLMQDGVDTWNAFYANTYPATPTPPSTSTPEEDDILPL